MHHQVVGAHMSDIDILNIDLAKLPKVAILDALGVLRNGFLLFNEKPDNAGLASVIDPINQRLIRIHPTRLNKNLDSGSMAVVNKKEVVASCPYCNIAFEVNNMKAICPDHGEFIVIGGVVQTSTPVKETKPFDLSSLSSIGDLWVKNNIPFDNTNIKVVAANLRVGMNYLVFNLYGGSFGKKNMAPPLDELVSGKIVQGIYTIKDNDIDKWHKRLEAKGYKQF